MLTFLIGLGLFSAPSPVLATELTVSRLMPLEELTALVYKSAKKYGADPEEMLSVVKCEAEKTLVDGEVRYVADGQSHHRRPDGSREQSYGLAQWYLPALNRGYDNEVITERTAKDPIYSLNSMAYYFANQKQSLWTCWKYANE